MIGLFVCAVLIVCAALALTGLFIILKAIPTFVRQRKLPPLSLWQLALVLWMVVVTMVVVTMAMGPKTQAPAVAAQATPAFKTVVIEGRVKAVEALPEVRVWQGYSTRSVYDGELLWHLKAGVPYLVVKAATLTVEKANPWRPAQPVVVRCLLSSDWNVAMFSKGMRVRLKGETAAAEEPKTGTLIPLYVNCVPMVSE